MVSANQMSRVRFGIALIPATTGTIYNKLSYNDIRRKAIIIFKTKNTCFNHHFHMFFLIPNSPVILSKHALCRRPENISSPMIAYIIMTKSTKSAIWKSGIIAINIALRTIWRPEINMKNICNALHLELQVKSLNNFIDSWYEVQYLTWNSRKKSERSQYPERS